jgi:hypothetical protein
MVNVFNQIIIPIIFIIVFIFMVYSEYKHPKYKYYRDSKGKFRRRKVIIEK